MQNNLDEHNSMCHKILTDVQQILNGDNILKEFTIVPLDDSRNKSPVLYEEHCLGLESWCVKHVYHYVYTELLQLRPLFKKGNLTPQEFELINKLLLGALLLHPDVTTFWNMRRELIEKGVVTNIDKELVLTRLVLSHKSKSNECFMYRKWIINKLTKNIIDYDFTAAILLNNEFEVSEMAAEKSPNNYHAWSYRIWCLQHVTTRTKLLESSAYLTIIINELDFSNVWAVKHVSEHTGFHYRQYLCSSILKNGFRSVVPDVKYHCLLEPFLGVKFSNCDNITYLNNLIGKREVIGDNNSSSDRYLLKCYNYVYYFTVLLVDLFYIIEELNKTFPGHEAIWYHRRFVVFSLLAAACDYHNIPLKRSYTLNKHISKAGDVNTNSILQGNGEKSPKLLKYDTDKVESSYLYKLLLHSENKFIEENTSENCDCVQKDLAIRHGKWLKLVLCLSQISV